MTAPDGDRIVRAAQADYDHAQRLFTAHERGCASHGCPDCRSLLGHCERTGIQLQLLRPPADGTGMEPLF